MVTGNNIAVGADLVRRCYWVRLDARHASPDRRTGFRHPDLLEWVRRNRGRIVTALLTIARAWYAAGRPKSNTPPVATFTEWANVVGGMLAEHAPDFLANADALRATVDTEAGEWETFLIAWRDRFGDMTITARDVADEAERFNSTLNETLPYFLAAESGRPGFPKRLGEALRRRSGRRYGSLEVLPAGTSRSKVGLWTVVDHSKADTSDSVVVAFGQTRGPAPRESLGVPAEVPANEGPGNAQ